MRSGFRTYREAVGCPRESVFVTVPTTGMEHVNLAAAIEQDMLNSGHEIVPNRQVAKPVSYCRNRQVNTFLNDPRALKCDWFYTVDSDTCPPIAGVSEKVPEGALCRLLKHAHADPSKKVIAGVTFSTTSGINWMPIMSEKPDALWSPDVRIYDQPSYPLVKVDGVGAACMLVHRDVIEEVMKVHGVCFLDHFDWQGRRTLGQDLDFCRKVRHVGYDIWVDVSVVCSHFKTVDLKDITETMLEQQNVLRMLARGVASRFGSVEKAAAELFPDGDVNLDALKEFEDHEDGGAGGTGGDRHITDSSTGREELSNRPTGPELDLAAGDLFRRNGCGDNNGAGMVADRVI